MRRAVRCERTATPFSGLRRRAPYAFERQYENEFARLNDREIILLERISGAQMPLTGVAATDVISEGLRIEKWRLTLRERFFRRMSKSVSPAVTRRFVQIDSLLHSVVAIQIAMNAPLVK